MKYVSIVLFLFVTLFGSTLSLAKEIKLSHNGLTLNGELKMAQKSNINQGALLFIHGGLAHRDMSSLKYFTSLLLAQGFNVLSINLSLSINDRKGMYDCKQTHKHTNEDALEEIDVWIKWLNKQGANKIILLAHSRGGAQSALYVVKNPMHKSLKGSILLAPATIDNGFVGYKKRYQAPIHPLLSHAKKLVDNGMGNTVLKGNMMFCRDTEVTAESFYSYYRNSKDLDSPYLIAKATLPTLVIIAGADELVFGLDKKVKTQKRVTKKVIDGADHFFLDLFADDAVDAMVPYIKSLGWK